MAGVKIESDDEELAEAEEVRARFELLCVAVEGISREKAQNKRSFQANVVEGEESSRRDADWCDRDGRAPRNAENVSQTDRRADVCMAHGRDYTLLRGFSRCRCTGQRRGQEWGAVGGERLGMAHVLGAGGRGNKRGKPRKEVEAAETEKRLRPYSPNKITKDWGAARQRGDGNSLRRAFAEDNAGAGPGVMAPWISLC